MGNLTFEEGLLKEHTPEPLEGHDVVVFERVGEAGERFHALLPPGTPLEQPGGLRRFFGPRARYFGLAVDASPELHLDFAEFVRLGDYAHDLELSFDVYYGVSDPRLLASVRNRDPLRLVRDRVRQEVGREVARLPWADVRHAFAAASESAVAQAFPGLRSFAAGYGLDLRRVHLRTPHLSGRARGLVDSLADIEVDDEIHQASHEAAVRRDTARLTGRLQLDDLNRAAQALDARDQLQGAAVTAAISAIKQLGGRIATPEDFLSVVSSARSALATMSGADAIAPPPAAAAALGSGGGRLPPATGRLGGLLAEVVSATQPIRIRGQRDRLRAALLHVVAEVVEDVDGSDRPSAHAARAAAALDALSPAPSDPEMEGLRALASPAHLRAVLQD